jgi:RHS repeat-associated protein
MNYVLKDHIGSLYATITDGEVEYYSFDAWGRERNHNTLQYDNINTTFDSGFTGHEHHYDFGLINMNGRMYDPYTSMFLSPDNYIQAPDNSQSFNRYAYCLNNPLKYTDPDGEFWHIIAGAALGGSMNLIMNWSKCEQWYDFASYFAIGAVAGGLGAGVGAGVSSAIAGGGFAAGFTGASTASATGFVAGAAIGGTSGFTGGFIIGTGNSLVAGDSFGRSLYNGLVDGAIGLGIGAVIGGIAGGVKYRKDMMVFRKGSVELGIDPANSIPENMHNDNFLIRARNVWYPDAPKDNLKIFLLRMFPLM